jgi:hypothetical protein
MGLLLFFELLDEIVQCLETLLPGAPVSLEPIVHLEERLSAQLVEALLGAWLDLDQPGLLQDPEVLRNLWLLELEPITDVPDRPRTRAEQLDDSEAVRFCESGERLDHVPTHMPI